MAISEHFGRDERLLEQRHRRRHAEAEQLVRLLVVGQTGNPSLVEEASGELAHLVGDHRLERVLELVGVDLVHPLVLAGDDDVDAVGALDVLVEPVELLSSWSTVKPTAPRTPMPPVLHTAATTSRQWVKAKIGNSMSRRSAMGVRIHRV